jgi:hypothetical protein
MTDDAYQVARVGRQGLEMALDNLSFDGAAALVDMLTTADVVLCDFTDGERICVKGAELEGKSGRGDVFIISGLIDVDQAHVIAAAVHLIKRGGWTRGPSCGFPSCCTRR